MLNADGSPILLSFDSILKAVVIRSRGAVSRIDPKSSLEAGPSASRREFRRPRTRRIEARREDIDDTAEIKIFYFFDRLLDLFYLCGGHDNLPNLGLQHGCRGGRCLRRLTRWRNWRQNGAD